MQIENWQITTIGQTIEDTVLDVDSVSYLEETVHLTYLEENQTR